MPLRDYQSEAHDCVMSEFEKVGSTLVVWPTGMGKTVLAASIIKEFSPKRSIFIAHRDTLVYQAKDTIEEHANVRCAIEMAGLKAEETLFGKATTVVTTVQTQLAGGNGNGRMTRFNPDDFELMIVDEAHHYTSPAWRKVLEYYRKNPKLKVMGITATPDRADEQALGQIFETVAVDYEIQDGIHNGWLVPIEVQEAKIADLDYSAVKITAGDLNLGQLNRIVEAERICQGMVGAAIEIVGDRQFVFFTASVAQAETVANIFNRHRQGMCEWIYEATPKDDRKVMLDRFRNKETQGLANVGILTEGWDDRSVSVCFMGRPTLSRSLYAQCAGRILRPLVGLVDGPPTAEERRAAIAGSSKPSALVVDYVGNSGRHKLVSSADILGGKYDEDTIERAKKHAREADGPVRMDQLLDKSQQEIAEEIAKRRQEEEARKVKLVARVKFQTRQINPFDALDLTPSRPRGWDNGRELSEKQRNLLFKQGIDPTQIPYGQAKQLIGEMFRRWNNNECSFKQARILRTHGYDVHKSREEASAIIDIISAQEGWSRKKQHV